MTAPWTDPLRLDAYPSRRFLPRDPGEPASGLGVDPARVVVAESPGAALELVLRTLLASGDRVATFEPCPDDHFRVPISCGARVIDAGRDASLHARMDGLLLVAASCAAVLVAEPGDPAPVTGDAAVILSTLARLDAPRPWVIVDRRAGGLPDDSHAIQVLSTAGDTPVGVVVAPAEVAAALRRMRGPASATLRDRVSTAALLVPAPPPAMLELALGAQHVIGPACHAWLRVSGLPGREVAAMLEARGLTTEVHPTFKWREGVKYTHISFFGEK
ncbi:MAG: hypothetical protein AMXMBFR64_01900 [Myxococcales bacterium]